MTKFVIEIVADIGAGIMFTLGIKTITTTIVLELDEITSGSKKYDKKIVLLMLKAMFFFGKTFILLNQSRL
jgi:hypothetical protein